MSITIKFLESNLMLIKFNGDRSKFGNYIYIMTNELKNDVWPNTELGGGWIIHYSKLDKLKEAFHNIEYLNEYEAPEYLNMGSSMKLQPYEYQKEAIYFAINNLNSLMVLPCGSGKRLVFIV